MDKAYSPESHDIKWQKFWDSQELARPEVSVKRHPNPTGKTFSLIMPPPNVTGVLHQGHALMLALEDTLTRWHRMLGDESLYLPGTDHASIAVNMQVVKHLASKGIDYKKIGREEFLKECWKWIEEYQPRIFGQIRALGTSCDWTRAKFTMDPVLNKSVDFAFVELYKRGLIYRAERLVNWSPKGQTGLSDLEVLYEDRDSSLWHLRYPLAEDPKKFLVVATTRPETMLGDTAVAVNPKDDRYKAFVGKKIRLPIVNREIPIIADDYVDAAFGTGVVKITPAHDFNDFDMGLRHNLPKINIFTKEAKILAGLPGEGSGLAGLDRFDARKKVLEIFESRGLVEKTEKHKNRVGIAERHGDIVEPFLSNQWYLKMDKMAKASAEAVTSGQVEIVPHEFHNQFMRWMENIHDWCISRQVWWGQQIPAYHCEKCAHIEVAISKPENCVKCGNKNLIQDADVLDTWFSSALWPFSTLGWPDPNAQDFKKFYPTQVLETGFDILFFWVARMLMTGLEFTGKAPFSKVYLHPIVRDADGQKMSKTKGNVIDPLEIVKTFGADTLRLTLNGLCVQGRDLRLSEESLDSYRNFINKVWNATKFAMMGPTEVEWRKRPLGKTLHDRWILARLDATARDLNRSWSEFRMQEAASLLYHFFWNDFCDWYLESSKTSRELSQPVVLHVLAEALKMLHPLCPHVSEELWHELPGVKAEESLSVEAFPLGETFADTAALAEYKFIQDFVSALRNLRSESKVPPGKKISIFCQGLKENSKKVLSANQGLVASLARLEKMNLIEAAPQERITKVVVTALEAGSNVEIVVPLSELVDLAEEKLRLSKEVESLRKIVESQEAKLSKESFVSKAPPEVVDKERIKLSEAKDKLLRVEKALAEVTADV